MNQLHPFHISSFILTRNVLMTNLRKHKCILRSLHCDATAGSILLFPVRIRKTARQLHKNENENASHDAISRARKDIRKERYTQGTTESQCIAFVYKR